MSVPRILLIPTHHTGLADAVAAAVTEIMIAQGRQVRYHHVGAQAPLSAWDRWEGAVFVDPALTGEEALFSLYDVAVRHGDLSILSASEGLFDRQEGIDWVPADLARLLDCPVVVVMDCRGWGTGMRLVTTGIKLLLAGIDLAGVILSGVADREHYELLKGVLAEDRLRVVGCLFEGQGLGWDSPPPGAWGLPLTAESIHSVRTQVDVSGLVGLASQRGFLAAHTVLSDRSAGGPLVMVASGKGFTPWSRDSIELLKSARAQVRRLDLLDDTPLPVEAAGLILAGTLWPDTIQDIAMNTTLLRDISAKIRQGLPTLALGGGMLLLLAGVQDTLGRTSELAGVMPVQGEILWDLEAPAYVEIDALHDNLLLEKGERVTGWALSEIELSGTDKSWDPPLALRGVATRTERGDSYADGGLLCSLALIHLGAKRGLAERFVDRCARYADASSLPATGTREREQ